MPLCVVYVTVVLPSAYAVRCICYLVAFSVFCVTVLHATYRNLYRRIPCHPTASPDLFQNVDVRNYECTICNGRSPATLDRPIGLIVRIQGNCGEIGGV